MTHIGWKDNFSDTYPRSSLFRIHITENFWKESAPSQLSSCGKNEGRAREKKGRKSASKSYNVLERSRECWFARLATTSSSSSPEKIAFRTISDELRTKIVNHPKRRKTNGKVITQPWTKVSPNVHLVIGRSERWMYRICAVKLKQSTQQSRLKNTVFENHPKSLILQLLSDIWIFTLHCRSPSIWRIFDEKSLKF